MTYKMTTLVHNDQHYSGASVITDANGFELVEVSDMPVLLGYTEKLGVPHWSHLPGQSHLELTPEEQRDICRRVVASWNACHGVSTEVLEGMPHCFVSGAVPFHRLQTLNRQLLATLQQCLPIVDAYRRLSGGDGDIAAANARALMAQVKS